MKLKEEVKTGISECFESLQRKGYKVSGPQINIDHDCLYELGSLLPKTIHTQITATIVIALTEADIELEGSQE